MHHTGVVSARQEPFDALPRAIQSRDDLTFGAKCLYGALASYQRLGLAPSYADLAFHLAASTRSIIRWVAQLVSAGLISCRRRGQGLTNIVTVLALAAATPDRMTPPEVTRGRHRPGGPFFKNQVKKMGSTRSTASRDYTSGALGCYVKT